MSASAQMEQASRDAKREAESKPNNGGTDWIMEAAKLAALHPGDYDQVRKAKAKELGCRTDTLDTLVTRARGVDVATVGRGRPLKLDAVELWPEVVNGNELATSLAEIITAYVSLPNDGVVACVLWILHTHAFEASPITPRLAIQSPVKRCGKTTLLEIIGALSARFLLSSSITAAATFRTIELARPTLGIDEADTFLPENDELRGILNSGHRKTGEVIRTVEQGGEHVPMRFSTWSPVAVAMIGKMPDTLADRSIIIAMQRRLPGQQKNRWRCDRLDQFIPHVRQASRWASDATAMLLEAEPIIPSDLHDRAADNWRPLLAIADLLGGDWPALARKACIALSGGSDAETYPTMLLSDIRDLWMGREDETTKEMVDMDTKAILDGLHDLDGRPWGEFGKTGKPLTSTKLAGLLKGFKVFPRRDKSRRFYARKDLAETWSRYLPPINPSAHH